MKADGLLGRNFLKGMQGDVINAILCGAGHNMRKILARLRALFSRSTAKPGRFYKPCSPTWKPKPFLSRLQWLLEIAVGVSQDRL